MKILVPVSKVPDTTSKIAFADNKFVTDNVQFIMNPTDEWYALTRAIELKEANPGSEVVAINVGLADADAILQKALAIGADSAVRIDADPTDAYQVAQEIANHIKSASYDLVITGKETIDYNSFEVGGMLAELLEWNAVALVSKLDIAGTTATATRDIEGGTETVTCSLPAVICATKDLAQARIPNMKGIMAARTKPKQVLPAAVAEKRTAVVSYSLPEKAKEVKMVSADHVDELVRLLHEEAKVI
ncbi:MAG: electron transfer flavoprotein subunit beta/FixA family protein [Chitinophagales bacterium]